MSSRPTKTKAETLLLKAAEDEVLLDWDGTPDAVFGFHAQQAAEKLMKALLAHLGIQFELTHDLTRLAKSVAKVDQPLPDLGLPLRKLTRFGVVYRYEFQPLAANPDRATARNAVKLLRTHVEARIAALSASP